LHACLHVILLSPINPLCSTTPLLPPLFSAPFSSAALRQRCCWCCPHCTRYPRCCCCCCVQCLCLHQLMVLLGYEQPWCVTLFCAPAAPAAHLLADLTCPSCLVPHFLDDTGDAVLELTQLLVGGKTLFKPIPRQPRRIKNYIY